MVNSKEWIDYELWLLDFSAPCIRRLLRISHLQRITDAEVLRRTNQIQISTVLHGRRLRLFGYVARSDGKLDHTRALRTVISGLPSHWRRPPDRPRWTWKADRRKGSECTQHRPRCGMETSAGSWTVATNSGSSYAPIGACPRWWRWWWWWWCIGSDATQSVGQCRNSYVDFQLVQKSMISTDFERSNAFAIV